MDGVPGFHDLFQLGKINHLITDNGTDEPYERVIVDTPSTGHAKSLFSAAASIRELTVVGPVHDEAKQIAATICDKDVSGAILVTNPEMLPISETLSFTADWHNEHPPLTAIVINRWLDGIQLSPDSWRIAQHAIDSSGSLELSQIASNWQRALHSQQVQFDHLKTNLKHSVPIGLAYETVQDLQQVKLEWLNP